MADKENETSAARLANAIKIEEKADNLSVADCISNWVMVENAIPRYDHKLIVAIDNGVVLPGWFKADVGFSARLYGSKKTDVLPIAWRLYPPPPGREIDPGSRIAIIKFIK